MAEPALRTRYEDHYGTASASPEENTGTIIGTSDKGPLYTRLSFTGEQGLRDAELIYGKTGALPHRLREAMGAAQALQTEEGAKPVTIRAVRVGEDAAAAEIVLLDADSTAAITITIKTEGTDGNAWSAMVEHEDETRIVTLKRSEMTFLDADGASYNAPVAAAVLGAWLTKSIDRSMVNIRIPNATALIPPFEPAMRNSLADGRVVYARTEVGRGIIIANSKTLASAGSDFAKAQDLRTVYTCGAEARAGGMFVWGKSDDSETNDGLRDLEEAMSKPLRLRVGKSITGFDVKAEFETGSTTDVVATMGVTPRNSMEKIDHVVVIRRAV